MAADDPVIHSATLDDCRRIALLHRDHIGTGFLSSLGVEFLTLLYRYLVEYEILLVARKGDDVVGFISSSPDTSAMMKQFVRKKFFAVLPRLIRFALSPAFFKKVFETLFSPKKAKESASLDHAVPELLSIVVSPDYRGSTVARELLAALEIALRDGGHSTYKVIAGAELTGANKFYLKQGFTLAGTLEVHDGEVSNIYLKDLV